MSLHEVINHYKDKAEAQSVAVLGVGEAKNWIGYEDVISKFVGIELSFFSTKVRQEQSSKVDRNKRSGACKSRRVEEDILVDQAVDISITLHSLEPNGNEQGARMLNATIDSASKYTLLFEPDYSEASKKMKDRMIYHDYIRNIDDVLSARQDIKIVNKFLMEKQETDDNLTTCWVLEKIGRVHSEIGFVCPISGCQLQLQGDFLYSPDTGLGYPSLNGFKCLNPLMRSS